MSDRGAGKWLPYDLNGSVHDCKKETGTRKVETNNNQQPLTLEQIDARLRRIEAIIIGSPK